MDKSNNFLVKYLVVELFEKIFRIKKFINTAYEEEKRQSDKQLKDLYDKALIFIANELNEFCSNLPPDSNNAGTIFDNMLFISKSYSAIINIHKDLKDLFPAKIEKTLFEAFLNGYDSGYDAKASNMINDNVGDAVRYIRRNFNEDFEL